MFEDGEAAGGNEYSIVIEDPADEFWEGAVVVPSQANVVESRGGVVLPCDPRLFRLSGIGGFHRRAWGSGVPLGTSIPKMHCPMTIYVAAELHSLHWAARLVPDFDRRVEPPYTGQLRIAADTGQPYAISGGVGSIDDGRQHLARLGEPDERGGWTIRGRGSLQASNDGFVGIALYGMAMGLRVVWSAVSLTL